MKRLLLIILILSCYIVYAQQSNTFKMLTGLTGGTWQMKTAKGYICERWTKNNANVLKSVGFKVTGADTTILEKVSLIQKGNDVFYVPIAKGQNGEQPVYFKLIASANKQFIFSNPEHDFPQRVVYQFITQDSVHAFVDGKYKGKYVKQDFYYKRIGK